MRRFDPGYTDLRPTIASGALGDPVLVHSAGRGVSGGTGRHLRVQRHQLGRPRPRHRALAARLARWSRSAGTRRRQSSGADFADPQLILLRTADGVLSTVEIFLNARYGYDVRCEVVGETGTASLRRARPDRGRQRA